MCKTWNWFDLMFPLYSFWKNASTMYSKDTAPGKWRAAERGMKYREEEWARFRGQPEVVQSRVGTRCPRRSQVFVMITVCLWLVRRPRAGLEQMKGYVWDVAEAGLLLSVTDECWEAECWIKGALLCTSSPWPFIYFTSSQSTTKYTAQGMLFSRIILLLSFLKYDTVTPHTWIITQISKLSTTINLTRPQFVHLLTFTIVSSLRVWLCGRTQ